MNRRFRLRQRASLGTQERATKFRTGALSGFSCRISLWISPPNEELPALEPNVQSWCFQLGKTRVGHRLATLLVLGGHWLEFERAQIFAQLEPGLPRKAAGKHRVNVKPATAKKRNKSRACRFWHWSRVIKTKARLGLWDAFSSNGFLLSWLELAATVRRSSACNFWFWNSWSELTRVVPFGHMALLRVSIRRVPCRNIRDSHDESTDSLEVNRTYSQSGTA